MKRIYNFLLLFFVVTFLLLPSFSVVSNAEDSDVATIGYYELKDGHLHINGNIDFSIINEIENLRAIEIENAIIDEPIVIDSTELGSIKFTNCYFDTDKIESNTVENIFYVFFSECELENLEIISGIDAITDLEFWKCRIDSLKGIEKINSLRCLTLHRVGIESIEELNAFDSFDYLTFRATSIKDISPLKDMNIKFLDLSDSLCIESLEPIMQINDLSTLYLQNCDMLLTDEIVAFIKQNVVENDIAEDCLEIKKQIKSIAEEIVSDEWSDYKKTSAVAGYIAKNMEYDCNINSNEDLLFEYNAHVLRYALQGIGCCKNFATFFTVLLQEAGINVYEVYNDNHVWNMVELDGEYYWIDGTGLPGLTEDELVDSGCFLNKEYDCYGYEIYPITSSAYNNICENFPDRSTRIEMYLIENIEKFEDKKTDTDNLNTEETNDKKENIIKIGFSVLCSIVVPILVFILMKVIRKKRNN